MPASRLTSAVGTVTRAIRTAGCGRIARGGRRRATFRSLPRKMRPKRYLPEESKQIWSRLPTPMQDWTDFFLSQARSRYLVVALADGQRATEHCHPAEAESVETRRALTRGLNRLAHYRRDRYRDGTAA